MAAREPEEPSSAPRPPKKRFVPSSSSSSPTRSVDEDNDSSEDAADPLMEPFEDFRRDAIFRQWKEYMRFGKRYKKRKLSTENRKQTNEASLNIWESQFQQLRKALHDLVSDDHAESLKAVKHQRDENNSYQSILDSIAEDAPSMTMAMKRSKSTPITDSEISRSAQSFRSKRQLIAEKIKPLLDPSLQNEYQDALSQWQSGEKLFSKTKDNLELHTIKYLALTEELQLMTRKLDVVEALTHETRLELANAENRLVSKNTKLSDTSSLAQGQANDSIENSSSSQRPLHSPSSNEPSEKAVTETTSPEQENALVQVRRTLERQLKDIEEIKEERIELKQKIAQEEIDLISLPASRIHKFSTIYVPEDKLRDYRQESDRLLMECRRIREDRDNLKRNRRVYMQERDTDQLETIQGLQNKLHGLDRELNEVRGQRDALQIVIDGMKQAGNAGRASLPELKLIAQSRKERASILETELLQLHKKCAALTGNSSFYEMAMAIDDENEITIKPVQHELRTLEETIKELRAQLAGQANVDQQQTLDNDIEEMLVSNNLKRKVDEFQEKYGFQVTCSDNDSVVVTKLKETLESIEMKINETQKTLKTLESSEIESSSIVAEAFKGSVMFDEQNMAKIEALVKMENDVSRVRAERGKYHQVFNNLNKGKDASKMVGSALTVQNNKEIAYMMELIGHRRNMRDQISNLDREITQSNMALEIYQTKKDEFDETLKDLKERANLAKDKAVELEKSIMEKIRLIEQGAHERLRIEENSELLRRRIEATVQEERPAETRLRNEIDEFRALLYCGSCGQRVKSHVIMRCMHTFCKECLDARLDTRQRRCPTCNESFGVNDVKQFFF